MTDKGCLLSCVNVSGRDLRPTVGRSPSVWGNAGSPSPFSPLGGAGCVGAGPLPRASGRRTLGWRDRRSPHTEASQPRTLRPLGPGFKVQPRKGAGVAAGGWTPVSTSLSPREVVPAGLSPGRAIGLVPGLGRTGVTVEGSRGRSRTDVDDPPTPTARCWASTQAPVFKGHMFETRR